MGEPRSQRERGMKKEKSVMEREEGGVGDKKIKKMVKHG